MGCFASAHPFQAPYFQLLINPSAVISTIRAWTWVELAIFWSEVATRFNALIGVLEGFQKMEPINQ